MALLAPAADRASWHTWRQGGAGASDVAPILGLSKWSSPFSVWAEKVGLVQPEEDLDDDDPREFGRRAEAMIAPWFTDKTGLAVIATQLWAQHDLHEWMRATTDGAVSEVPLTPEAQDRTISGLEIKVDYGGPWYDGIPMWYQPQGQWQMACTGWERVWFAVLHGRRFRVYALERDEADIQYMIERVGEFWQEHVLAQVPPPIDDSEATHKTLARMYPDVTPGKAVSLDHIQEQIELLKAAREAKAKAKADELAASNRIAMALEDAEIGMVGGFQELTYKAQVRRTTCKHCMAVDTGDPFRVLRLSSKNPRHKGT